MAVYVRSWGRAVLQDFGSQSETPTNNALMALHGKFTTKVEPIACSVIGLANALPQGVNSENIFISAGQAETEILEQLIESLKAASIDVLLSQGLVNWGERTRRISKMDEKTFATLWGFPKAKGQATENERTRRIREMEAMFKEFAELPDGWDSYGGLPISEKAIEKTRRILVAGLDLGMPESWTAPGGHGGTGLEWETDYARLFVNVSPVRETKYLLTVKGDKPSQESGVLDEDNLNSVLRQFQDSGDSQWN